MSKCIKVKNELKEKIIKKNDTMHEITQQNKNLKFQIELHPSEAEQNTTEIKRELDHKKRKAWLLLTMKINI